MHGRPALRSVATGWRSAALRCQIGSISAVVRNSSVLSQSARQPPTIKPDMCDRVLSAQRHAGARRVGKGGRGVAAVRRVRPAVPTRSAPAAWARRIIVVQGMATPRPPLPTLRACESFDFCDSPPESNQGLSGHENRENRKHSHSLRARDPTQSNDKTL